VPVTIVGGGLAGSECAWQLAERGVEVTLVEQKPERRTPAQKGDGLAELVCSNSFRGSALVNAVGLIKEEMRRAGSLVMAAAEVAQVPAGGALAVDREVFSAEVTRRVDAHLRIRRETREVTAIPEDRPVVLATGPLTGDALAKDIEQAVGAERLAYYDAIAPVVSADSIDWEKVFRASRYDKGGDDAYVNCPMTKDQYEGFVRAVLEAEKVAPHGFEDAKYFEGCLPLEVMAERGLETLAYGPMKPVGLTDPRTGRRPHAVVQLRQEDKAATAYNLVGFQTRMKWPEQKRVFRMIPGLENAEFVRRRTCWTTCCPCVPARACTWPARSRASRVTWRAPPAAWCSAPCSRCERRGRSRCVRPRPRPSAPSSGTCAPRGPTSSRRTWCGPCSRRSSPTASASAR